MIDIEKSQVISYGDGRRVTVYRDFQDADTYYVVPVPTIPKNDHGVPEFALVEYKSAEGLAGLCTFQVELQADPDAVAAVKAALGDGIKFGQFDWQTAKAWFKFVVNGKTLSQVAEPAMYGDNRASFVVPLPTKVDLQAFKNAFGPSGSAGGTFELSYDVTSLARLPNATVTVSFNSDIAAQYQKTVHVSRNTWGHVTSRSVTIRENLSESQAGKVTIDPGGKPLSDDLRQKLLAWGNATLEADVDRAVNQAMALMRADRVAADAFSIREVASFRNVYSEGQVVPWVIAPQTQVAAFPKEVWTQVFSTIDERDLRVSFTVQNLDEGSVESVAVTVDYPTKKTENTREFDPTTSPVWLFRAPGNLVDGKYDGTFTYRYTVHYSGEHEPYESGDIRSTETEIFIDLADLAVVHVTFDGVNVPFSGSEDGAGGKAVVERVEGDFFFVNDGDGAYFNQSFELTADDPKRVVSSVTRMRFTTEYVYTLKFVLSDGTAYHVGPISDDRHHVVVDSPFQTHSVSLYLIAPDGGFEEVIVDATYKDPGNDIDQEKNWQVSAGDSPEPWTFVAPLNVTNAEVRYQGLYIVGGQQTQIQPAVTTNYFIAISTTQSHFAVSVDPSQIEWDDGSFTKVVLTKVFAGTAANPRNVQSHTFIKESTTPFLYTFLYDRGTTPTFHWAAEYWVADQPKPEKIVLTTEKSLGTLTLPGRPSS